MEVTKKTKNWLLTAANMPDCVATGAFAHVVFGYEVVFVEHTRKFAEVDVRKLFFGESRHTDGLDTLTIIGTFWKNDTAVIAQFFSRVKIYAFGDKIDQQTESDVSIFTDVEKKGAIKWITDDGFIKHPQPLLLTSFLRTHNSLLDKCNKRCFGIGDHDVQVLFTGIYASASNGDLFKVFVDLFTGELNVESVILLGKTLLANHMQLADERARKNHKFVTLRDGSKAVVTEGPELINFTHDALRTRYQTDVTIVVRWQFDTKQTDQTNKTTDSTAVDSAKSDDKICYSVRTNNPNVSAYDVLKHLDNAGGSNTAAGAQVSTTFTIPF
jgi:hypothetical protein